VEACSAHDGSWGVSRKYFPVALKIGKKLFNDLGASSPDVLVSDCPLAAHQIQAGTGRKPIHTAQALAAAYGLQDAPSGIAKPLSDTDTAE
jgi:Fe-S oxidoreductase